MDAATWLILKQWGVNFGVAFLASLVRWQLLPREERRWYDIFTFLTYAMFVIYMVNFFIDPIGWEESTKRGIAMASALLANEIIRGLLQITIRVMPALEDRVADIIKRGRL